MDNEALEPDYFADDDRVDTIGRRLQQLASEQIGIRQQVEERWLADLEQYNGRYDAETLASLEHNKKCKLFNNITRPKTLAAEARLADMLFPSDDRNWAIQPTPVPQLPYLSQSAQQALMQEAESRCKKMQNQIDDQLVEADYHRIARDLLHDTCLFGTGVIKAVVVKNKVMRTWKKINGAVHELVETQEYIASCEHVKLWDFFPDMSAHHIDDCEFVLERRYLSRTQLKKLAKRPEYKQEQILKVLEQHRTGSSSATHISRLREMSGLSISLDKDRFEVWEYHGVLTGDDLKSCGCEVDNEDLETHSAVVVFCNGIVIKAELNLDETGDLPYAVMIYEKDDSSLFGLGIPYLLRDEQKAVNAAWRMGIDNSALTSMPQIVFNNQKVRPADGSWELYPGKLWLLESEIDSVNNVFATHEISSHQAELFAIYELAKKSADDVTNLPLIAQGASDLSPETAVGTSMLMNAANTTMRRIVKYFDDHVTERVIGRFYNWNMQFSDKEDIKGDFNVDARGSSVLLVKEVQNQTLQQLLSIAERPIYAPLTKHAELYRKAVQSQHIKADDVVKSDEEIARAQQQQDPLQQLEIEKIKADIGKKKADTEKVNADVTATNVEGMYSAIQASKEFSGLTTQQMLALAQMTDEIYKSAGGKDYNQFPIVNPQSLAGVQQDNQNTHPQFPPNPQVGMMEGIDA